MITNELSSDFSGNDLKSNLELLLVLEVFSSETVEVRELGDETE